MAYTGNTPTSQGFTSAVDYFNGDGVTVAFTLSRPVASVYQVEVVVDNVVQNPSSAYNILNDVITFTGAPLGGTNNVWVRYVALNTVVSVVQLGTVGTPQLATNLLVPVAKGGTGVTTSTGTGNNVLSTSPVLVTPNIGAATATSITGMSTPLSIAQGGTGLSSISHTVQVFTSGSGTYTLPTNCKAIKVTMVGGGGGGGGSSSVWGQYWSGAGGTTTFGTLSCDGGGATRPGEQAGNGGGTSLTGAVGIGIIGGDGAGPCWSQPNTYLAGGNGGSSGLGGSGKGTYSTVGNAGKPNSGGGGGGGGSYSTSVYPCAGGGAGGYIIATISTPSSTYSYAIGAGGTAGPAGNSGTAGGAGGSGVIMVEEFYV